MAHIDTLKYYESLVHAGNSELEAKAHIYAITNGLHDLVTKDDLHNELTKLENKLDVRMDAGFNLIHLEMKYIKQIGYFICIFLAFPIIKDFILPLIKINN